MKKPASCLLFLISSFCGHFIFGQSQTLQILELKQHYDLQPYLWILETDEELLPRNVMEPSRQQQFVPYLTYLDRHYSGRKNGKSVIFKAGHVYWGKIKLANTLPQNCPMKDWLLFLGRSKRTVVYVVNPSGEVVDSMFAGFLVPAGQKDFNFGNLREERVKLSMPPEDTVTLFIKMEVHKTAAML